MTKESANKLSPNQQALLKIRELKQLLAEARQGESEPIAIVSMACRFPRRSRTPEEFWQCLMDQTDEVSEIPEDRWDLEAFYDEDPDVPGKMYARHGVFLDNLDLMDPEFFGISPREATWVDPQQRLLLEVGWEALERAGWTADKIGESTGIFVGWMHNDYQNEASDSFLNLNPYIATGAAGSFLCGRLAYYLGLQGPSIAVDTACSSSLVALHLACQSLQRRDCDHALVGGVNAICSPTTNILTCKLQALSPNGHSRAFDAAADGYLRGEGCGVVTLRRLSDAQRDGDPILGIIRGSAVGHNGFSSGLTAPNPKAQEKVIREALRRAGISPHEVAYLEAHGTGTELGDPIEMQAAAAALTTERAIEDPLLVGSVKTNIGHLEAAAGMAGLIKVLLSIEKNKIPGQLNFENPNPHIAWDKTPVRVLTAATDWPNPDRRIAGVSAFGMSGTNAHVVIEAASAATGKPDSTAPRLAAEDRADQPHLIVLSGKNEEAIQDLAEAFGQRVASDSAPSLSDVAFTTSTSRKHFEQRAGLVVRNRKEAIEAFKTVSRAGKSESVFQGNGRRTPKIAWQFTGQGSQYAGMARGLYEAQPVFRDAIDHCSELLQRSRSLPLTEVLFDRKREINHTSWTQPGIFAVQMGLARLLQSWGLQPDVVLGHSVGQYAAACVAGILSWDDGLRLISERGRLIGELPSGGRMLAVFAPLVDVEQGIQAVSDVSLAAVNGTHIVVSGPESSIETVERAFTERGIRSKALTTSHAFHSSLMDPALDPFQRIADQISFTPANLPLICNRTGKALDADAKLSGEYWARHIRDAVRYSESIETVQEIGCELLLELGPQSVLTRMAAANWQKPADTLISCLQKDVDDSESILKALAGLYVHGATPDFEAIYADGEHQRVLLPTYPFQRRRFWGPDKPRAFHAEFHTAHPLLGAKVALAGLDKETRYESFLESDSPPWLPDHEVMGHIVLPGAAYVEMALAVAAGRQIEDLVFEQPLRVASRTALQTVVRHGDDKQDTDGKQQTIETFSCAAGSSTWTRNFTATVTDRASEPQEPIDLPALTAACQEVSQPEEFYRKMSEVGLTYGPKFQTIDSLRYSPTEVLTHLSTNGDIRGFTLPPTLLDGALHSLAVGLLREDDDNLFLPVGMGRMQCFRAVENECWCHARWIENEGKLRTADLTLFDGNGQVVARIDGLRVQQVSRAALRQMSGTGSERLLYELNWQTFRLPASSTVNTSWLIIQDGTGTPLASQMAEDLLERGHQAITLHLSAGSELVLDSDAQYTMCGESLDNWKALFEQLSTQDKAYEPAGIAWMFETGGAAAVDPLSSLPGETRSNCVGLLNLLRTLQERGIRGIECGLQLITADAMTVNEEVDRSAQQTQYWGLGRVLGAEHPELRCRLIDVSSRECELAATAARTVDILLTETRDNQLVIRDDQFFVPRMRQIATKKTKQTHFATQPKSSYLITGGLGMLGRQAAKWLADNGAEQVVLVSRRSPDADTQAFLTEIEASGCQVIVESADLSSHADVERMFARFGTDLYPLAGVIHAAGVLDDALIGDQSWERFEKVLAPKVVGAGLLHEFTKSLSLDFFVLYSSVASVLGPPGQSNYATANAYLDGLAWQRRSLELPAVSINWGPWTAGMADDERIRKRLALQGITPLSVSEAHEAMERILAADLVQATVLDVDWRRMRMGLGGESPAMLEGLAPAKQRSQMGDSELVAQLKRLTGTARKDLLVTTIQGLLQGILSTPDAPEIDRPLIEMGLDSLMAVEFGTELQQMLGEQFAVGPTMLFEHPTIEGISEHVLELVTSDSEDLDTAEVAPRVVAETQPRVKEPIAIIGMSCRFPGAENVEQFWSNLLNRVDSVSEIPEDRWDVDRFYSADRQPGKMYTREGGFLDRIGDFDAAFFNISEQEACWVDPQHRMLLENSYLALEDAGISPYPLSDANVGVFMGIMGQDYAFLPKLEDEHIVEAFQGAGLSHSAGVGRISYVFGFEGPCIAVDTASSSSLVALCQAVSSLQAGSCNMALAGGVNAILAPANSLLMSKAALLSPDGRCKSFSAGADGFGRGEGCGVVLLKRLSDARRDGDRIMAVVRGGAVVHNGFSGGITSPSGRAQTRVINEALRDADIAPAQVQYLEAHGTGTEFGDPMEIGAAASAYGKGRRPDQPLLVGSVKANISHLEAAGGISGVIKTVLALQRGVIPSQVHFDAPSPHVPWNRLPVKIVTEETAWPETDERIAGITALGLVGTNAHVVLSSPPEEPADDSPPSRESEQAATSVAPRPRQLLVMSARNELALTQLAGAYQQLLESGPEVELADICHTAATGRRHYEHRIALTIESHSDALQKLNLLTTGDPRNDPATQADKAIVEGNDHSTPTEHHGTTGRRLSSGIARGVSKGQPKIAWVFTGDRSSQLDAARAIYEVEPTFRELIDDFDERLAEHFAGTDDTPFTLRDWFNESTDNSSAAADVYLYALQAGLAALWQSWGIEPDAVLGFGVGQYAAASVAGALCFKDALTLICEREKVLTEIRALQPSPDEPLTEDSHLAPAVKAALDRFESFADTLTYYPPNLPLVCSLSGEIVPIHRSLGGSYWRRHCLATCQKNASIKTLRETNCDVFLEIGPQQIAARMIEEALPDSSLTCLSSIEGNENPSESLLHALGELYIAGATPDFQSFNKHWARRRVRLPSYPFQKRRYWITEVAQYITKATTTDK